MPFTASPLIDPSSALQINMSIIDPLKDLSTPLSMMTLDPFVNPPNESDPASSQLRSSIRLCPGSRGVSSCRTETACIMGRAQEKKRIPRIQSVSLMPIKMGIPTSINYNLNYSSSENKHNPQKGETFLCWLCLILQSSLQKVFTRVPN